MIELRMSEAGHCPRGLSAKLLGMEPLPVSEYIATIMEESSRHEAWVKEKLHSQGHLITEEQKEIELWLDGFHLVGHIDGLIGRNGEASLLEVKALGRFEFYRFLKEGLNGFPQYEAQISAYMLALPYTWPASLVVKCRDTGAMRELVLLRPSLSCGDLEGKLRPVKEAVERGEPSPWDCSISPALFKWCRWRYLCAPAQVQTSLELVEAAKKWREAKALLEEGEAEMAEAKAAFTQALKGGGSLEVDDLKATYTERVRTGWDKEVLKELVIPDILARAEKRTPYWELRVLDRRE